MLSAGEVRGFYVGLAVRLGQQDTAVQRSPWYFASSILHNVAWAALAASTHSTTPVRTAKLIAGHPRDSLCKTAAPRLRLCTLAADRD